MPAPAMPPEEKFWQRYSPHNELPLSGAGTLTVYVLMGLLVLGGVKLSLLLAPQQDYSTGALAIDSEDGDGAPAPGTPNAPEAVELPRIERPVATPAKKPDALPRAPVSQPVAEPSPQKPDDDQLNVLTDDLKSRFGKVAGSVPGILDAPPAENRPGNPGGKQGKLQNKPRVDAMLRWNMVFDTKNGDDYRKQLESLGAILAIPTKDGQYQVIRELKLPVKAEVEDLQKLQRVFWVDDNNQSVRNLATALKLPDVPAHIVAFFPAELEQKLTALEKKFAGNRPVANVKETRFRILLNKQGVYEPVVVDQR